MKSITCFPNHITIPFALLVLLSGCVAPQPLPPVPSPQQTGSFPCGNLTGFPWENLWFDGGHVVEHSDASGARLRTEWMPVQITRSADGKVSGLKWESRTSVESGGILGGLLRGINAATQHRQYSVEWDDPKPTLEEIVDCLDVAVD